jgi:serine O-acetyltransferase
MFSLIGSDLDRYRSSFYLRDKPLWRRTAAGCIHLGFRTSCYYRVRSMVTNRPIFVRLALSPLILLLKLLLMPSGACDISSGAKIGPGLLLPHPIGVVVAPQAVIGRNCTIFSDVVLGINHINPKREGPWLGDCVTLYTGAKLIGGIHIGSNTIVGANAVVIGNMPSQVIVAGVPAKIIQTREKLVEIPF